MERSLPQAVPLPTLPSNDSATHYDIFISGDYEIRLFGDPHTQDHEIPVQSISLSVKFDDAFGSVVREATQDVVCDFVDNFAFGDAIGLGLRSVDGWWTVTNVSTGASSVNDSFSSDFQCLTFRQGLTLTLIRPTRIAEGQTRIVPIRITQTRPFSQAFIDLKITLTSGASETIVTIESLPVKQLSGWTESVYSPIKGTYFYARSMPTVFLALPPRYAGPPKPPILALRTFLPSPPSHHSKDIVKMALALTLWTSRSGLTPCLETRIPGLSFQRGGRLGYVGLISMSLSCSPLSCRDLIGTDLAQKTLGRLLML